MKRATILRSPLLFRKLAYRNRLFVTCLALLGVISQGTWAGAYRYEGMFTSRSLDEHGQPQAGGSEFAFRALVSGNCYRISLVTTKDRFNCLEQTAGSDGVDCYSLEKTWSSSASKQAGGDYREIPRVTPGTYPDLVSSEMELIWILLASNGALTNGQSLVLANDSTAPDSGLSATVQYDPSSGFLKRMEMHSPGVILVGGKERKLHQPFDHGYKLWDMAVNLTNHPASGIPRPAAVVSYYFPGINLNHQPAVVKTGELIIRVTNAVPVAAPVSVAEFLPRLGHTNLLAEDYRWSPRLPRPDRGPVGFVQYRIEDGKWLGRADKRISRMGLALQERSGQGD